MIIELVGPPGAGKTTLVPGLRGAFEAAGIPIRFVDLHRASYEQRNLTTAADILRTVRTNPVLAVQQLRWRMHVRGRDATHALTKVLRLEAPTRRLQEAGQVYLVDEGLIQRAIWAQAYFGWQIPPSRLASRLPRPGLVVRLDVGNEESLARIRSRGGDTNPGLRSREPAPALDVLERYRRYADELLGRLGAPVVTDPTPETVVAQALAQGCPPASPP